MCYKIIFGLANVHCSNFLQLSPASHTRGHTYKLYKQRSLTSTGTAVFGNRVINVWNNLSQDTVDFSIVKRFKSPLILSDLSEFFYNMISL